MKKKKTRTQTRLRIGVVGLIPLLVIWLTVADFFGDTDVAAKLMRPVGETIAAILLP